MNNSQKFWLTVFLVAFAAFFYSGIEILAKHSDWSEFKTPVGTSDLFRIGFAVVTAVTAALNIDISKVLGMLKGKSNDLG